MGCCRVVLKFTYNFFAVFFCLATLLIAVCDIAGSTNYKSPNSDTINLVRFNLTEANIDSLVNTTVDATSVTDLGLSEIYSFTLWGYCKGFENSDDTYNITYCSKPKSLFGFHPLDVFNNDLNVDSVKISFNSDYNGYVKTASSNTNFVLVFGIIGFCLSFLTLVLTFLSFWSIYRSSTLRVWFGLATTIVLFVTGAAATKTFKNVIAIFDKSFDEYGISVTMGDSAFYGLLWAASVTSLVTVLFNALSITKTKKVIDDQEAQIQPMNANVPTYEMNLLRVESQPYEVDETGKPQYNDSKAPKPGYFETKLPRYEDVRNHEQTEGSSSQQLESQIRTSEKSRNPFGNIL